MVMIVHEYLTHDKPETVDSKLLPPSWCITADGTVWREESYIGATPSSGGPDTFDEIQTELDILYALGVRGRVVFADDIEHSVFEICFDNNKMYKDYLSFAPKTKEEEPAQLPLDAFGNSLYMSDEIELPPNDMEKVMLILEFNAARITSQLRAYGLNWSVSNVAAHVMRVTSDSAQGLVTEKQDAVQLVLAPE